MPETTRQLAAIMFTLLLGCLSCNNCGESVKIGEYLLMDKSLTDWAPYEDVNQLTFRDLDGNDLIFTQTEFGTLISDVSLNTICNESFYDTSYEFIETESKYFSYQAEEHSFRIVLLVCDETSNEPLYDVTNQDIIPIDKLYDRVSYSSYGAGGSFQGRLVLIANDRQNSISPDILLQPEFGYSEEIEINGQVYADVWSYNREDPVGVFTPVLYVKQGVGILAFMDDDGTLWNLVN